MDCRHDDFKRGQAGDNNETVSLPILLNPRLGRQMPGVGRQVTWRGRGALSYLPWVRRKYVDVNGRDRGDDCA